MTSDQAEPLLGARQLTKTYGNRALFTIDSLQLYAGEATLLTGRNGAGKSTLLKILAGLEPSDSGELRYRGSRLNRRQQRNIGGRVIYLHQQPFLFDSSAADNIGYGLKHRLKQLSRDQRHARVEQALAWSGLSHLAKRNAKTLSGGEKQRVALARAWVMEPELLLMDEPTTNMDTESRQQTLFLIRRLINEGKSIVVSSHELKGDPRLFQRQWHLSDGRLRETTQPCDANRSVAPKTPRHSLPSQPVINQHRGQQ